MNGMQAFISPLLSGRQHLQVILQVYCGFALNNAQIDIVFAHGLIVLENAQGALDMAASIILTSKGANLP